MPNSDYLLRCPKGSLGLLVHLPDIMVLDGEDDKAAGVLSQQWFVLHAEGWCLRFLVGEKGRREKKKKKKLSGAPHEIAVTPAHGWAGVGDFMWLEASALTAAPLRTAPGRCGPGNQTEVRFGAQVRAGRNRWRRQ